jgi:hypothetical protein
MNEIRRESIDKFMVTANKERLAVLKKREEDINENKKKDKLEK